MQNNKLDILMLESKRSFDFFWQAANTDLLSKGYGLIRDRAPSSPEVASIASVGFGLTAIVIGIERGWITYNDGLERVRGTLNTLLNNLEHQHGFYYHFLNINTGEHLPWSEVSVIDTAIAICGVITAGEYFQGEVKEIATKIYERVDWQWYVDPKTKQFYMGYNEKEGHFGRWDHYAEQFMMYILGAASPTYPISPEMFYLFERWIGYYAGIGPIIHSMQGALFVYQFSHAWFDFRDKVDQNGVDWFNNSKLATIANRQFCIDHAHLAKTFGENSWGLTACDGPNGYSGQYGAKPNKEKIDFLDSTIPPCGAAGSIVFTPEESIRALNHYYNNYPELWGKYGFQDAYNLDVTPPWFAQDVIGIDKGITLLMIENYLSGLVWKIFMNNSYVQKGMELIGFKANLK